MDFWKAFKTNWIYILATSPDLLYLEDAWWREHGFAALKIHLATDALSFMEWCSCVEDLC